MNLAAAILEFPDMRGGRRQISAIIIGAGLLALPLYTELGIANNAWQLDRSSWVMAWYDNPGGAFQLTVALLFLLLVDILAILLAARFVFRCLGPPLRPGPSRVERSIVAATLLLGALDLRWLYSFSLLKLALPVAAVAVVWLTWRTKAV